MPLQLTQEGDDYSLLGSIFGNTETTKEEKDKREVVSYSNFDGKGRSIKELRKVQDEHTGLAKNNKLQAGFDETKREENDGEVPDEVKPKEKAVEPKEKPVASASGIKSIPLEPTKPKDINIQIDSNNLIYLGGGIILLMLLIKK